MSKILVLKPLNNSKAEDFLVLTFKSSTKPTHSLECYPLFLDKKSVIHISVVSSNRRIRHTRKYRVDVLWKNSYVECRLKFKRPCYVR